MLLTLYSLVLLDTLKEIYMFGYIRPHYSCPTIPKMIFLEGPRSRSYGRTAALRLIVQPL
jgi:hypothetical protein